VAAHRLVGLGEAMTTVNAESVAFVSRPSVGDYMWNAIAISRSSLVLISVGTFATTTSALAIVLAGDTVSVLFLLVGLSLLSGVFSVPFMWWPIHRRRDLVLAPVDVVADEGGISFATATSSARHGWSVFRRVRETPRAFLFDTGVNVAILLAKRGIADGDVEALRSLLHKTGTLQSAPSGVDRLRPLLGVAIGLGAAGLVILGPLVISPG
jgi:hypothetical protein